MVPWKFCAPHDFFFMYGRACPLCGETMDDSENKDLIEAVAKRMVNADVPFFGSTWNWEDSPEHEREYARQVAQLAIACRLDEQDAGKRVPQPIKAETIGPETNILIEELRLRVARLEGDLANEKHAREKVEVKYSICFQERAELEAKENAQITALHARCDNLIKATVEYQGQVDTLKEEKDNLAGNLVDVRRQLEDEREAKVAAREHLNATQLPDGSHQVSQEDMGALMGYFNDCPCPRCKERTGKQRPFGKG